MKFVLVALTASTVSALKTVSYKPVNATDVPPHYPYSSVEVKFCEIHTLEFVIPPLCCNFGIALFVYYFYLPGLLHQRATRQNQAVPWRPEMPGQASFFVCLFFNHKWCDSRIHSYSYCIWFVSLDFSRPVLKAKRSTPSPTANRNAALLSTLRLMQMKTGASFI